MCNINILIKNNQKLKHHPNTIAAFIDATANSFACNSDAEGFYISKSKILRKSVWRLNMLSKLPTMLDSDMLIDHTRISTSGFTEHNTQPFKRGRFIISHNGILNFHGKYPDKDKSDTAVFCDILMTRYKERNNIGDAISEVIAKDISSGSYSIAIYDEVDNILYYFKNYSTSFWVHETTNYTFMSTMKTNSVFFSDTFKSHEPKPNQLYRFSYVKGVLNVDNAELPIPKYAANIPYNNSNKWHSPTPAYPARGCVPSAKAQTRETIIHHDNYYGGLYDRFGDY